MSQEIDYAAVLADLEAKRASLDAAIAAVRSLLGQPPSENGASVEITRPASTPVEPSEIRPGTFHGLSVAEAARKFLEMTKKKQRTKDIVEAIKRGGIESTADNFYSNVYTTLMRRPDFKRMGKSWGLAAWYPTIGSPAEKPAKSRKRKRTKGAKAVRADRVEQPARASSAEGGNE